MLNQEKSKNREGVLTMQLLTVKEVAAKLSIGVSTVWAKSKDADGFPQSFPFSARQTRWIESEVDAYIQSLVDSSRNKVYIN
jgi:predicted DNA-binding transcriptional regulator AlpA